MGRFQASEVSTNRAAPQKCKHTRRTGVITMHRCERDAVQDGYCSRHHPDYVAPSMRSHLEVDERGGDNIRVACGASLPTAHVYVRHPLVETLSEYRKLPKKVRCAKCDLVAFPEPNLSTDCRGQ